MLTRSTKLNGIVPEVLHRPTSVRLPNASLSLPTLLCPPPPSLKFKATVATPGVLPLAGCDLLVEVGVVGGGGEERRRRHGRSGARFEFKDFGQECIVEVSSSSIGETLI